MLPPTDKDLLNDRHFRTSAWPMNDPRLDQTINVYMLPIPPNAAPGDYCLEAVVYEANTIEALPVSGAPLSECIPPPEDSSFMVSPQNHINMVAWIMTQGVDTPLSQRSFQNTIPITQDTIPDAMSSLK